MKVARVKQFCKCFDAKHSFLVVCLADLMCIATTLFLRDKFSLQALKNNLFAATVRFSLGNSLILVEGETLSGSEEITPLPHFAPLGGLLFSFCFLASSDGAGLLSLSRRLEY